MKLFVHKAEVTVFQQHFPAGESLIRIDTPIDYTRLEKDLAGLITVKFKGNGDLIDLLMLTDAARRKWPGIKLSLCMDYLPYARQDRVCNPGEALSVKVVADLINGQNYERIYCKDIHSEVGNALLDRLVHTNMNTLAAPLLAKLGRDVILVSPDAGANKKVFAFAKEHAYPDVLRADKTRNPSTGEITGTALMPAPRNYEAHDFLILDDICDGGRTFIELAKVLQKTFRPRAIFLYVTHGIFSKGADVFEGFIDRVYTSNLMGTPHRLVEVI